MTKHALVSVYDKSNLNIICSEFKRLNIKIISTGSTASKIKSLGYKCIAINKLTKSNELLEGRVKTLHPHIYASILFLRSKKKHFEEFKRLNFPIIDFVIVNLYPFEKTIIKNTNDENCVDMIDIGGPTLLRAGAKNFDSVTTINNPGDYKNLINNLNKNFGKTDLKFRKKMAVKSFYLTSQYDLKISEWLGSSDKKNDSLKEKINLRYGENPHQKSYLLKINSKKTFYDNLIQGKELSYNNLRDSEVAFNCVNEFTEPTCVVTKHCSPCGVASAKKISNAW